MRLIRLFMHVTLLTCAVAQAQQGSEPSAVAYQLAVVDFGRTHQALIERCEAKFPSEVPALRLAISQWSTSNGPAQASVREMQRTRSAARLGISPEEADDRQNPGPSETCRCQGDGGGKSRMSAHAAVLRKFGSPQSMRCQERTMGEVTALTSP